jgi:hypothetical protein
VATRVGHEATGENESPDTTESESELTRDIQQECVAKAKIQFQDRIKDQRRPKEGKKNGERVMLSGEK